MEYRGINLADSVRLYNKNGDYNKTVKKGLDTLATITEKNGHLILSEYIDAKTVIKIDFRCGHEMQWMKPDNYTNRQSCPKCSGRCPEQAKEDFISLLNENGHLLISEYINAHTPVVIDYQCGHGEKSITPANYKSGYSCNKCGSIRTAEAKIKKATEELIIALKLNGHEWINGEYVDSHTKILIDFKCGHKDHWITPANYKSGKRCWECGINKRAQNVMNECKHEFNKLVESNGHELLSEYAGSHIKVLIDFKCNHDPHWIKPTHYKGNHGCPFCNDSKGEKRIRKWLKENKIPFEPQMEYDELVGTGGGNLSYDFYLPKQNLLIEYQGEFHDGSKGGYTSVNLEKQQEHDRRKKSYAELNNIRLLEIWYWDFDSIEDILQNELT